MATITEFHNPSFASFPHNNNRTAWRSFGLPMIMVVADTHDKGGNPISDSRVTSVRILIEDVPRRAVVAGHDHVGLLFPDRELFARTITNLELADRQIPVDGQVFFNAAGTEITFSEAKEGDFMQYETTTGIRDTITYLPTASYYDLSDIMLDTEELEPDYYYLSYQAAYYVRVTSGGTRNQLICIDTTKTATAVYRFRINHPGQVMEESVRLTPAPNLTSASKAEDTTIAFYRPYTDAMQDMFDELGLLKGVNWVNNVAPAYVPYLAYLLGLDIPFFPRSLDQLRRTMLRNVVRLQQLKGSRRALVELFELFGYAINIINLYWAEDGSQTIRPGAELPAKLAGQEIDIIEKCQIEPLLSDYDTDGFGELTVPLMHRPTKTQVVDGLTTVQNTADVVVDTYLVTKNSTAYDELVAVVADMNVDPSGYGESVDCDLPVISGDGLVGFAQITVDGDTGLGGTEITSGQEPPFIAKGISLNRVHNVLNLTFNGSIQFSDTTQSSNPGQALFAFATYDRQELVVPTVLQDLRSNRFDIQLLARDESQVTPDVLEFLVDFLFKLKAFHSLLNVIIYRVEYNEVYEVTDFCVGGDYEQRHDTDAGKLQVPPAIIPGVPDDGVCALSSEDLGYKDADLLLRERKLDALVVEHAAWKALDDRDGGTRSECKFNDRGQDRIVVAAKTEHRDIEGQFYREHATQPAHICEPDGFTDYCYKGRVADELLYQLAVVAKESVRCRPCNLSLGYGVYYTYPVPSRDVLYIGGTHTYTGDAVGPNINQHQESVQKEALQHDYAKPLPRHNNNKLGKLLRSYDSPQEYSLHYLDRLKTNGVENQKNFLALQRPELDVQKSNLHHPGTRFVGLGNLEDIYTDAVHKAKPWDTQYSELCGPLRQPCGDKPDYLNAELVENTNGDLVLSFDDVPYTILANGLIPDIASLGDHTLDASVTFTAADVVHAIYMQDSDGHPAIDFEEVVTNASPEGTLLTGEEISIGAPLFSSANRCNTEYEDSRWGYGSQVGWGTIDDFDISTSVLTDTLLSEMEVPVGDTTNQDNLFWLVSGIRDGSAAYRLDCGCELTDCGTAGEPDQLPCILDKFLNADNEYEFDCDQLEIDTILKPEDVLGGCSFILDGTIPTLFELSI